MKKICIAVIAITAAACIPKYKPADNPETMVLDYPHFKKDSLNENLSVDKKYSLSKLNLDNGKFVLKHSDKDFFHGDNSNHYYLDQIFEERFLFITVNKKPNMWSSVSLIPRDSVIMYDMDARRLYYFNAGRFLISLVKFKYPLRSTKTIIEQQERGYTVAAIIDGVNINNNELLLLLEDYKSMAVIKLNPVSEF